ncbi:MAG TPA: hypothetical protein VF529_22825 [Solirubrobacteraceae bacterium]|jgi:hypothetical protein
MQVLKRLRLAVLAAAVVVLFALPATAQGSISGFFALAPGWTGFSPVDDYAKINVFYYGGGTFRMCGKLKSDGGYTFAEDCGYVYESLPQVHAFTVDCRPTRSRPWVWNGDNNAHNFEVRVYNSC